MIRRTRWVVVLLGLAALAAAQAAERLEGRWRLVEQRYNDGQANQADADRPVRLELEAGRDSPVARIWAGDARAQARPWPALEIADEARPVLVDERGIDLRGGELTARYRVEPAPGDGLVLRITERYRLSDDGESLVGTVRVDFTRDGEARGGYVLHRRFEREP